jgi:hypothetical protein
MVGDRVTLVETSSVATPLDVKGGPGKSLEYPAGRYGDVPDPRWRYWSRPTVVETIGLHVGSSAATADVMQWCDIVIFGIAEAGSPT